MHHHKRFISLPKDGHTKAENDGEMRELLLNQMNGFKPSSRFDQILLHGVFDKHDYQDKTGPNRSEMSQIQQNFEARSEVR